MSATHRKPVQDSGGTQPSLGSHGPPPGRGGEDPGASRRRWRPRRPPFWRVPARRRRPCGRAGIVRGGLRRGAPGSAALPVFVDATFLLGDVAAARRLYLRAAPRPLRSGATHRARRRGPGPARHRALRHRDRGGAGAWCAPAGILLGVLPRPAPQETPPVAPPPDALSPGRRDALGRARGFVDALVAVGAARGEAVIERRRTMKRLSPALFAAYMDRVARPRPG